MEQMDEYRRAALYVDVMAGSDDTKHLVHRFPNDETGHARAVQYRNAYNESLQDGMGVSKDDLELERPNYDERPDEYRRAVRADVYRLESARLSYVRPPEVIANDAPLPTDYPHDYQKAESEMTELTRHTTHYIVHSTVVDPLPESTYGTSAPYSGEGALGRAIKAAYQGVNVGRRAFVTARDDAGRILAVVPVVDYPTFGDTHMPEHAQAAITDLFDDLDWTT